VDIFPEKLVMQSSYYYVGHFSKYVRPGAKRIGLENKKDKLQSVAFRNQDGTIALVVLNETDQLETYIVDLQGKQYEFEMNPHSIHTVLL
jgi:glucosylceramidase